MEKQAQWKRIFCRVFVVILMFSNLAGTLPQVKGQSISSAEELLSMVVNLDTNVTTWEAIGNFTMPQEYADETYYRPFIRAFFARFEELVDLKLYGDEYAVTIADFEDLYSHTFVLEESVDDLTPQEISALNHLRMNLFYVAQVDEPERRTRIMPHMENAYDDKPDLVVVWREKIEEYSQLKADNPAAYAFYRNFMLATGYAPQGHNIVNHNNSNHIVVAYLSPVSVGGGAIGEYDYDPGTGTFTMKFHGNDTTGVDWQGLYGFNLDESAMVIDTPPSTDSVEVVEPVEPVVSTASAVTGKYPFDYEELIQSLRGKIEGPDYTYEYAKEVVDAMIYWVESNYREYLSEAEVKYTLQHFLPKGLSHSQDYWAKDYLYNYYLQLREAEGLGAKKLVDDNVNYQVGSEWLTGQKTFVNNSVERNQFVLNFDQNKVFSRLNSDVYDYGMGIVQESQAVEIMARDSSGGLRPVKGQTRLTISGETWHQWSTEEAYLIINAQTMEPSLLIPAQRSEGEGQSYWDEYLMVDG